jgi:hypothetical protein
VRPIARQLLRVLRFGLRGALAGVRACRPERLRG